MADRETPPGWDGVLSKTAADFSAEALVRFEGAVVEYILKRYGMDREFRQLRSESLRIDKSPHVRFDLFIEAWPHFPAYLCVRQFQRVAENATLAKLVDQFDRTVIAKEWLDIPGSLPEDWASPVAMVFFWPYLKKKTAHGGAMVLHNCDCNQEVPGFFAGLTLESNRLWLESLPRFVDSLIADARFVTD